MQAGTKRPTLADVARLVGVSTATISYVVNEQSHGKVAISEETRRRVLEGIEKLGYQPDARARSLRAGANELIGLLIPDMQNPHYWSIVEGVEDEAHKAGYELLLSSTSLSQQRERQALDALSRRRIDALVVVPSFPDQSKEPLEMLAARSYPVVTVGSGMIATDSVITSYEVQTRQLMTHLFSLGHSRIGFVFGVGSPTLGVDRLDTYKRSFGDVGLAFDERLVEYCGVTIQDGYRAAHCLLASAPPPTALLVVNDLLAIGVLLAARERGLEIPADLSVASFDDIDAAAYLNPPLTTVRAHAREIGREAARLALTRINDRALPTQQAFVDAQLILRASTGPALAR
jgi:LacI family transcriptional regulator